MVLWEILIWCPLLVPPVIVAVAALVKRHAIPVDEAMIFLTVPMTLYHMFVLVRFVRGLPEIGVIPLHVILVGAYAAICFVMYLRRTLSKRAAEWTQKLSRWFGTIYFGVFTVVYSVAWIFPPL
jgi:hypothetical protein